MVEATEFRQALSRFASGITVVTSQVDGRDYGLTVSAFMSVSLEPPLVAVSIGKRARAHQTLMNCERFGVSILAADQREYSEAFAGRPGALRPPFVYEDGFPFVDGALAWLLCTPYERFDAGDHTILVGRVERVGYGEGEPLLHFRSRYTDPAELELAD